MNITDTSNQEWNIDPTGFFNGIPCQVIESIDVILDRQGKTTREFVESEEFQMLERAGIEVHSGPFDQAQQKG